MIRCPYCHRAEVHYLTAHDEVLWYNKYGGELVTHGIRCESPGCKGYEGFTARVGFQMSDSSTRYYTEEGDEIKEVVPDL